MNKYYSSQISKANKLMSEYKENLTKVIKQYSKFDLSPTEVIQITNKYLEYATGVQLNKTLNSKINGTKTNISNIIAESRLFLQ